MTDSDEHMNDEYQMEDPPARLLSPAEKKAKVDHAEWRLRIIKAQAVGWENAAQAQINDVRAKECDARAELKTKVQSAEEEAQSAKKEAEAKIQSAEKAVEEAQEYLEICRTELGARRTLGIQAIREAEAKRHERRAMADGKIQAAQELLDKARQEMTHDASSPGESG